MAAMIQMVGMPRTATTSVTQAAAPTRPASSRVSAVTMPALMMLQTDPYATSARPMRLPGRRTEMSPPTATYAPKAVSVAIS